MVDCGDTVGNSDVVQACTIAENPTFDGGDTVGNGDAGQAGAIPECLISNGGDTVGNSHAGEAGALIESPSSNSGDWHRPYSSWNNRLGCVAEKSSNRDFAFIDRVLIRPKG